MPVTCPSDIEGVPGVEVDLDEISEALRDAVLAVCCGIVAASHTRDELLVRLVLSRPHRGLRRLRMSPEQAEDGTCTIRCSGV